MTFGRKPDKAKAASATTGGFFSRRRRTLFAVAGVLTLTAAVAAAAVWGKNSPFHDRVEAATAALMDSVAQATGFTVGEILVVGREETPRDALIEALDANFGRPILAIDLQAARERMLALPWVSSVAVERVLPNTLVVHLIERRPMAVWQHNRQYAVIDRDGHVLERDSVASFPNLLVVSGEDAPVHAAALIDMLRSEPQLMERVDAAMRVGGRRWNVFLDNGISVRLPEEAPVEAWHRLAEYQRMHALLSKNIRAIDMRIPDKLILQAKGPQEPSPEDAAAAHPDANPLGGVPPRTPGSASPGQTTSGQTTNSKPVPGKSIPGKSIPGKSAPGKALPDRGDAGKAIQDKAAAGNAAAGKARPDRTAPGKVIEGKVTQRGDRPTGDG